ncbi:MAG: nucleotidyltransferase domain-containing protein [Nitrososphaerales archaeon]|nr:nucleotidyltransferase domain-containing protein [Nitrososphaerales archaeon]
MDDYGIQIFNVANEDAREEGTFIITNIDNAISKSDNMNLELRIVDFLLRNKKAPTIHHLSESLQEHYSLVHGAVGRLAAQGVVARERVGRSLLCSLNLSNEKTFALLQLAEIERRDAFLSKSRELKLVFNDLLDSLRPQIRKILAVVLYGSRAKGSAAQSSDIDVLLISRGELEVEKATRSVYAKYGKVLAPVVMTAADFRRQKDKALVQEIVRDHYVLYGAENFVRL